MGVIGYSGRTSGGDTLAAEAVYSTVVQLRTENLDVIFRMNLVEVGTRCSDTTVLLDAFGCFVKVATGEAAFAALTVKVHSIQHKRRAIDGARCADEVVVGITVLLQNQLVVWRSAIADVISVLALFELHLSVHLNG